MSYQKVRVTFFLFLFFTDQLCINSCYSKWQETIPCFHEDSPKWQASDSCHDQSAQQIWLELGWNNHHRWKLWTLSFGKLLIPSLWAKNLCGFQSRSSRVCQQQTHWLGHEEDCWDSPRESKSAGDCVICPTNSHEVPLPRAQKSDGENERKQQVNEEIVAGEWWLVILRLHCKRQSFHWGHRIRCGLSI